MQCGRLALNKAAMRQVKACKASHVVLLWDPCARVVALRPSKPSPHANRLNRSGKGPGGGFSAIPFFRHIGVDYTAGTRSFLAYWNEAEGQFEINLSQRDASSVSISV